jgi:Ras-related protein Rab-2A
MAKNITINDRNVRIQIWDTAGEEAFRSITRSYYKSSTCAFIVYDITEQKTFYDVTSWLQDCRDMCYKNILIYLIGNKSDLEEKRQVTYEEGKKFAQDNNLVFYETSALNGNNIEEIFNQSASQLVQKLEAGELKDDFNNSGIKVFKSNEGEKKKKKGCC